MKGEGMDKVREALAWREHVEQRLLTWRQRSMNKSGDMLALDDFMDKESLADLIDFVCDEWAGPAAREALSVQPAEPLPEAFLNARAARQEVMYGVVPSQPAPSVPAVPEGWQLVPKDPTDAMIDATYHGQPLSDIWHDMLAAAPHPAAKGGAT